MDARLPIILASEYLNPLYRWRLVASIYDSAFAIVKVAITLVVLLVACFVFTGLPAFLGLAALCLIIMSIRLWDRECFKRSALAGDEKRTGTPESWMKRHLAGALAAAAIWGAQDVCVLLFTDDSLLQIFVMMTQAGWIAGASVRVAASPATVFGQIMLSLILTAVCLCFVPGSMMKLCLFLAFMHALALLELSRFMSALLLQNMAAEQRAELINEQLTESNEKLARLSLIDGLTGIANRRAFDETLSVAWSSAERDAESLSVLMIDVDFFKLYNDRYGHQAGDECLRGIGAHAAAGILRPTDLAARYGGEEFVILLPGQSREGAFEVAERLRRSVAEADILHEASPLGRISVSIGVASVVPTPGQERSSLIHSADLALYEAKRGGRNRVQASGMIAELI